MRSRQRVGLRRTGTDGRCCGCLVDGCIGGYGAWSGLRQKLTMHGAHVLIEIALGDAAKGAVCAVEWALRAVHGHFCGVVRRGKGVHALAWWKKKIKNK